MNTVRITSGIHKGVRLKTPGGKTHPMGERERLALFNMIAGYLPHATVLDAYAGSGALGFEALSRGAKKVLFVDNNPGAESCIIDNMLALGYYQILGGSKDLAQEMIENAEKFTPIKRDGEADIIREKVGNLETNWKFDIILADPPYDKFNLTEVTHLVQFLENDGVFVLSHPEGNTEIEGLKLMKTRKYAAARLSVYAKI